MFLSVFLHKLKKSRVLLTHFYVRVSQFTLPNETNTDEQSFILYERCRVRGARTTLFGQTSGKEGEKIQGKKGGRMEVRQNVNGSGGK